MIKFWRKIKGAQGNMGKGSRVKASHTKLLPWEAQLEKGHSSRPSKTIKQNLTHQLSPSGIRDRRIFQFINNLCA